MSRKRRKYAVTVEAGFPIRHFPNDRFFVDIRREGLAVRQTFKDLESAQVFCRQQALQLKNQGLSGFSLTERQKLDAREAIALLDRHATLAEAAGFWLRHNRPKNPLTFDELTDKYLASLEAHNRRPASLRTARAKCRIIGADFGSRPISSITRRDIEQWFKAKDFSPAYRNIFLRYIKAILNFAAGEGYLETNPAAHIRKIQIDRKMPTIFPVKTVQMILDKAQATQPVMVPYLALGFFAGIRPNELHGLKWSDINLADGHIQILAQYAKTRRTRIVEATDNLLAWLKPYVGGADDLIAPDYAPLVRLRAELVKECGLGAWPQDVMRHSFATYHLAANDIQSTVRQLGHTSPNMLFDHYRGLTTKAEAEAEAERYWKIEPKPPTPPATTPRE